MYFVLCAGYINRLIKSEEQGVTVYEVRHAAVQNSVLLAEEEFEGCRFRVTAGDYQELLQKVPVHDFHCLSGQCCGAGLFFTDIGSGSNSHQKLVFNHLIFFYYKNSLIFNYLFFNLPLISVVLQVCDNLELAAKHSSNELERKMLEEYIASFQTGKLDHHKVHRYQRVQGTF